MRSFVFIFVFQTLLPGACEKTKGEYLNIRILQQSSLHWEQHSLQFPWQHPSLKHRHIFSEHGLLPWQAFGRQFSQH
eukprot:m.37017 g.37017  ORF g.37017 m.37017 type:complete len:77 (-) comp13520_c0_seq2:259-489(-)